MPRVPLLSRASEWRESESQASHGWNSERKLDSGCQAAVSPRCVNPGPSLNLNLKLVLLVSLLAPGSASQWRLLPRARVPLLSGVSLPAGPSGVTPSLKLEKYKSWQSRFSSVLSSRSCTDARRLHCFTRWWPLKVKRLFSRMQFCHSFRFCSSKRRKSYTMLN